MSEQQPPGSGEPTGNAAGKGEQDTRKQGRGKLGGRRTGAPQARERGAQRGSQAGQQPEPATQPLPETATKNGLSWIALALAVVLGVWQIIYAITMQTMTSDSQEVYTSVWLLISLVLAVACGVLGIVALSQRARPRWPATASVAIGSYVFLVSLAFWIGGLMGSPM